MVSSARTLRGCNLHLPWQLIAEARDEGPWIEDMEPTTAVLAEAESPLSCNASWKSPFKRGNGFVTSTYGAIPCS